MKPEQMDRQLSGVLWNHCSRAISHLKGKDGASDIKLGTVRETTWDKTGTKLICFKKVSGELVTEIKRQAIG